MLGSFCQERKVASGRCSRYSSIARRSAGGFYCVGSQDNQLPGGFLTATLLWCRRDSQWSHRLQIVLSPLQEDNSRSAGLAHRFTPYRFRFLALLPTASPFSSAQYHAL